MYLMSRGKTLQPDAALRYNTTFSSKLITICFKSNLSHYKCLQLFPVQQSGNLSIVLIFDLSLCFSFYMRVPLARLYEFVMGGSDTV